MEKTISLRGIATDVSTIYINRRTYHTFLLSCAEKGIYRIHVRDEDTEWDIEDGGHYCACGMEITDGVLACGKKIADGIMIATSVDRWGRICDVCGKWHTEGYWIEENHYACSDGCALTFYGGDTNAFKADLALLDDPATADDAYTYWTEWD